MADDGSSGEARVAENQLQPHLAPVYRGRHKVPKVSQRHVALAYWQAIMKIGFDAKRLFCNHTGLGNYSRTLLKNLAHYFNDHAYMLYTPTIKRSDQTRYFLDHSLYQTQVPNTPFKSLWRSYSVVNQFNKDNIDLFHGLSNELPYKIHTSKTKSIVTIHDLIFKKYPRTYPYPDRVIYNRKFGYSCKHANRIVAISQSTKNDIVHYYQVDPAKIDVVYQSCNPIYYQHEDTVKYEHILAQYNIPHEFLLSVGTIEKRKNLKTVLNAYNYIPEDLRIPLVVIGKGKEYVKEVKEVIRHNGLEQLIIFIDNLQDNTHLQTLYQQAKALLYPSYYEGFGLPVVEALLSRTPVITSNTSSLPEAGGPDSLYVHPDKPEELGHAIEKVLTDTALIQKMKTNGWQYAMEHFAPQKVTENMMGTYKKTLGLS